MINDLNNMMIILWFIEHILSVLFIEDKVIEEFPIENSNIPR